MGVSVLHRQQLPKSRLRKLASSTPSLAFEKRWEIRSPLKDGVSMVCTAVLRCTLKRSQRGCALRLGLAVEESLPLAQALSQEGILLKTSRLKATGCPGVTRLRDAAVRAKRSRQKNPLADFY